MKKFNANTKDAQKLLQTIKAEFILKSLTNKEADKGLWFELIEWDEIGKYHIYFYTECSDCHKSFYESATNTCASRLTMGSIRLNYLGTHSIQMSKQLTFDELDMSAIDV